MKILALLTEAVPLLFSIAVGFVILWLWFTLFKELLPRLAELGIDLKNFWLTVRQLTIAELLDFAKVRTRSLLSVSAAFMRRTRSLIYTKIYASQKYDNKRIANLIYELQNQHEKAPEQLALSENMAQVPDDALTQPLILQKTTNALNWLAPSPEMADIAKYTTQIDTTLWFDEDKKLAQKQLTHLIACGQFTMCFNMLGYILSRYGADSSQYPTPVKQTCEQAREIWINLKTDAFFLLRRKR